MVSKKDSPNLVAKKQEIDLIYKDILPSLSQDELLQFYHFKSNLSDNEDESILDFTAVPPNPEKLTQHAFDVFEKKIESHLLGLKSRLGTVGRGGKDEINIKDKISFLKQQRGQLEKTHNQVQKMSLSEDTMDGIDLFNFTGNLNQIQKTTRDLDEQDAILLAAIDKFKDEVASSSLGLNVEFYEKELSSLKKASENATKMHKCHLEQIQPAENRLFQLDLEEEVLREKNKSHGSQADVINEKLIRYHDRHPEEAQVFEKSLEKLVGLSDSEKQKQIVKELDSIISEKQDIFQPYQKVMVKAMDRIEGTSKAQKLIKLGIGSVIGGAVAVSVAVYFGGETSSMPAAIAEYFKMGTGQAVFMTGTAFAASISVITEKMGISSTNVVGGSMETVIPFWLIKSLKKIGMGKSSEFLSKIGYLGAEKLNFQEELAGEGKKKIKVLLRFLMIYMGNLFDDITMGDQPANLGELWAVLRGDAIATGVVAASDYLGPEVTRHLSNNPQANKAFSKIAKLKQQAASAFRFFKGTDEKLFNDVKGVLLAVAHENSSDCKITMDSNMDEVKFHILQNQDSLPPEILAMVENLKSGSLKESVKESSAKMVAKSESPDKILALLKNLPKTLKIKPTEEETSFTGLPVDSQRPKGQFKDKKIFRPFVAQSA